MLPEQAVLGQKAQAQGAAKTVLLVVVRQIDFTIQNQMEPVLTRMLRIAIYSIGIALDMRVPVFMLGQIQAIVRNRIDGRRWRISGLIRHRRGRLVICHWLLTIYYW